MTLSRAWKKPQLWIACCLASGMWPAVILAHHSIAGYYDSSRRATVEGTISRFEFVNPHPFMTVDVRRGTATEQWRLELDNRWEFEEIGITARSFQSGDRVVVTGSLARREPNQMYVERLQRPTDGFGFEQVNSRPRLRTSGR